MKSLKILIVEDELLIAKNIAKKIRDMGHEITQIVSSGDAVIASVNTQLPDLILMDIAIKGALDGIETAVQLKHLDIPVVYLTAYADDATLERAAATGCYGYLIKPFKERELYAMIKMVTTKHKEQSSIVASLQETVSEYSAQYNDIYQDKETNLPNQLFLRNIFEYILSLSSSDEETKIDSELNAEPQNKSKNDTFIDRPDMTGNSLAVFYIHLNKFQKINDSFLDEGRGILIRQIANRLTECVNDFKCNGATVRLSQNEFVIIITNFERREIATDSARSLLSYLNKPLTIEGREIFLSVSIGIAFYPLDSNNIEELLRQAKRAMEYAQEQQGNGYRYFTPAIDIMKSKASEELLLEAELHYALERRELEVYYQPKINLKTRQVIGSEALLRWNHPQKGLISPNKFIPLAEANGLILPINEWVIETACHQTKLWQNNGLKYLTIAVNLSISQFKQTDLFHKITQILLRTNLEAKYLELELTEKILIDNTQANVRRLSSIQNLGIQIALDDFGTGYSSLSYLQQFPFDIVKIDRCFVRDIDKNRTNAVITKTTIEMAHQLGLRVVAEGVETQAEYDFLKQNYCDEIQGFLISYPLSATEFKDFVNKRSVVA
jgi:diguanylate cyclase (GGDEF)-like protein